MIFGETLSLIYGCLQMIVQYIGKQWISSDIEKVQTDINRLEEWVVENEKKINPGKNKAVRFTKVG
jgi:hypothetical protein